jgi:Na+/H+-dicarboxylate symporter
VQFLKEQFAEQQKQKIEVTLEQNTGQDIIDIFINIIPDNPVKSLAEGNMLQIIFLPLFAASHYLNQRPAE